MPIRPITIAVEGCCHGELDSIYAAVLESSRAGVPVDLLLICGDFESIESESDLENMAVPPKYRHMNCFHEYVTGVKTAPVPTVFVGGNHEASNVLQSLYYGGYVAPNIFFLGFAGVVNFGYLRICGISGIQNDAHYNLGHYERPPYDESSLRSVYHIRELEIYRMAHLRYTSSFVEPCHVTKKADGVPQRVNIMLSHDWPKYIWQYGNCQELLRRKPGLVTDVQHNRLGSLPLWDLLTQLRPHFWFCAHLHVKFAAVVPWPESSEPVSATADQYSPSTGPTCGISAKHATRFLSLDKVLPGREFLQILTIPPPEEGERNQIFNKDSSYTLEWDLEWLGIIQRTHHLLHTFKQRPPPGLQIPRSLQPMSSEQDLIAIKRHVEASFLSTGLEIPCVHPRAVLGGSAGQATPHRGNVQTDKLLTALQVPHIWTVPYADSIEPPSVCTHFIDTNELDI